MVQRLIHKWYAPDRLSNDKAFLDLILERVNGDSRVLDAGAGAGRKFHHSLKDRAREVVGVDLDPRVETNEQVHRGIQADLTRIPVEDDYFDVAFCRSVMEHIVDPQPFLREIHRVLKPGGFFLFMTPNRWHYVVLSARLTPESFHRSYNRFRGREEDDTFPTVYRLNTARLVRKQFRNAAFHEVAIRYRECCPNYLTFSLPTFLLGAAYERLVNSTERLARFRVGLIGVFQKPA